MPLPLPPPPADYTACIRFAVPGVAKVEIQITPDPEQPSWLGRFSRHCAPGAVRSGLDGPGQPRWYVPDVSAKDIEEAHHALRGRQAARRLAHERIREDRLRLAGYGKTWSNYRLQVTLVWPGGQAATETLGGIPAHNLPLFGSTALIERVVAELIKQKRPSEPGTPGS